MNFGIKWKSEYLLFVSFYIILILVHGYTFGSNDQIDFMPYARHLQDPGLYPRDFYIQCMTDHFNERWLLAHFIAFIPYPAWPISFLVIHAVCTLLLIAGLYQFSHNFIDNKIVSWWVVCITLIFLYHIHLGGNELYYNMVCGSLIAKAVGVWALWFSYSSRWTLSAILSGISIYFHPVAGIQLFMLSIFFAIPPDRWKMTSLVFILAFPYLYSLYTQLGHGLASKDFVIIMKFRNPHHFFPEYFGIKNYLILVPVFLSGLYACHHYNKTIFKGLSFLLGGCLVYCILLQIYPSLIIKTQWFKTTIWVKYFSVLFIMKYLYNSWIQNRMSSGLLSGAMIMILFVFVFIKRQKTQNGEGYFQLPWNQLSPEKMEAIQYKQSTKKDDVFLVPPSMTAFKYYSERSQWVDWKAIPHYGPCLEEWKKRIEIAYGLDFQKPGDVNGYIPRSINHLKMLSKYDPDSLKAMGVQYIVSE